MGLPLGEAFSLGLPSVAVPSPIKDYSLDLNLCRLFKHKENTMTQVRFVSLPLPELELPAALPELEPALFQARYKQLEQARKTAGLDCLILYGDREHAANMAWLTDFSPRFEEALWVQGEGQPTLIAGNECLSFAQDICKLEANFELYQHFSLPNQPRDRATDLGSVLRKAGLAKGQKVGLVGWKPATFLDVPYWIVQAIQEITGNQPSNATHLLMDPQYGLRSRLEPAMIRFVEYAASITSEGIRNWVFGLKPGITEREAAQHFVSYGQELACHSMVNFGPKIASGLKSPRNRPATVGAYAQGAFGVWGSLTCRAGWLNYGNAAENADKYLELLENYLQTVSTWYSQIKIGAEGGQVVAAADAARADSWDFALNPGHLIHLDEWLSSPFWEGSRVPLQSGMAIQQDIIPVPRQGNAVINMEDGFVLADADLRDELQKLDPAMMKRIATRRQLMQSLGYEISEDILPLSNMAGAFFPFLLEPGIVARFS